MPRLSYISDKKFVRETNYGSIIIDDRNSIGNINSNNTFNNNVSYNSDLIQRNYLQTPKPSFHNVIGIGLIKTLIEDSLILNNSLNFAESNKGNFEFDPNQTFNQ